MISLGVAMSSSIITRSTRAFGPLVSGRSSKFTAQMLELDCRWTGEQRSQQQGVHRERSALLSNTICSYLFKTVEVPSHKHSLFIAATCGIHWVEFPHSPCTPALSWTFFLGCHHNLQIPMPHFCTDTSAARMSPSTTRRSSRRSDVGSRGCLGPVPVNL